MAQCPVAICPVTVHCPVVQCPTILLQVSECCILHSVYLCVSVTAYRLLNMHSAYFVGHLLHSYLPSELFICVEPHRLSTNCILSASCASCAHTFVHFSNSCLHRASLSLCSVNSPTLGVAAVLQSRVDQWLPNVDLPSLLPCSAMKPFWIVINPRNNALDYKSTRQSQGS